MNRRTSDVNRLAQSVAVAVVTVLVLIYCGW